MVLPVGSVLADQPPANDICAGAVIIPSSGPFPYDSAVVPDVTGATTLGDPPLPSCAAGSVSRSIWYRFTPSTTKLYTISTSGDTSTTVPDTLIGIYTSTGGCGGPYTRIDCNDDAGGLGAAISTTLNAGTTYYIVVWVSSSFAPPVGGTAVQLRVSQPVIPANDTCAGAEIIPPAGPFPYLTTVTDSTLATSVGDPPASTCNTNSSRSVWYRFTPSITGTYELSTCSDTATTVYDTLLGVYTSASGCGGPYTPVVCNDNACAMRASVTTTLNEGTTYYIVVSEASNDPCIPGETSVQLRVSRYFAPTVSTLPATSITSTGAVLNAVINPNHVLTSCWFEWGTSTNFGNVTPVQSLGSGSSAVTMSAMVTGIMSARTYYFRAVATNNLGTGFGTNNTFIQSVVMPQFTSYSPQSADTFYGQFSGNPGQIYWIETSTNLINWSFTAEATDLGAGVFQFTETPITNQIRFYRVHSP